MSKTYFLAKAKSKARKECKAIYEYLKGLPFTPAKAPMQLNNWCSDYVLGLNHFDGLNELKKRSGVL